MATVSLTMIVRDCAADLSRCLDSVRGLFDEVVVVDTGSRDRTRAVARRAGARVGRFAWVDDFAAARNAALDMATGDLAMWLDADEAVEAEERPALRALLDRARRSPAAAWVMSQVSVVRGDSPQTDGMEWSVQHVRLFPRLPGIRWSGRLHEQVMPSIRAAGIEVITSDVAIRHTGFEDPETYRAKSERNRRIAGGG